MRLWVARFFVGLCAKDMVGRTKHVGGNRTRSQPPPQSTSVAAEQDEKVLSFFLTVPQKWRLFWLTNIISISFSLALAGIVYVGSPSAVQDADDTDSILQFLPTWFAFAVNPAALTFLSFATSRVLSALCETRPNGEGTRRGPWLWAVLRQGTRAVVDAVTTEPWFYATLCAWFGVSCGSWWVAIEDQESNLPFFITVATYESSSSESSSSLRDPDVTGNIVELVAANLALCAGVAMLAVRSARDRAQQPISTDGPRRPSTFSEQSGHPPPRSRVPSLLVGWGTGYWLMSLLFLLGSSWWNGGWYKAPLVVSICAYIALPSVFIVGIFVVADRDILGEGVKDVLEPVVIALKDDTSVLHWAVVTVLRDVTMLWCFIVHIAVPRLNML